MRGGLPKLLAALLCLSATAVLIAPASAALDGPSSTRPALSVTNASAAQDAGSIVFTVRLSRRTSKRVTVRFATADGSATAGSDYSAVRGRLVFEPGDRVRRVSVPVIESSAPEDDETFYIVLGRPINARISGAQAEGVILAHDLPAAFKAVATLAQAPGSGLAGTGEFTMTLDAAKREASFTLTVSGLPADPAIAHIHSAKDSNLGVNIVPLPPRNGSVTGRLVLNRTLIIDMHENPGSYSIDLHGPAFAWAMHGALSLVGG